MEIASELPVLALRDGVLLPDELTAFAVGRPSSVAALLAALNAGGHVVVIAQRATDVDEPRREHLFDVGCAARIIEIEDEKVGVTVRLNGVARVRIEGVAGNRPMVALTSSWPDPLDADPPLDASVVDWLRQLAMNVLSQTRMSKNGAAERVRAAAGPGRVANMVAGTLAMSVGAKQRFLELDDVTERVRMLKDPKRLELGPGSVQEGWSRLLGRLGL